MNFLFSKKKKTPVSRKPEHNNQGNICAVLGISETGPVRDHNEDCIAFSFPENDKKNLIAVVADGMGGHNAGEVASKMACKIVLDYCLREWDNDSPEALLQNAFHQAHQEIIAAGESNSEQEGMGTTATAVIIRHNQYYLGHIGDSRAYLFRDESLSQLSTDHTLVNEMFKSGEITKVERDHHPMNNVLLQALGTLPTINPQISSSALALEEGDRLLLCSDGVYDALSEDDLTELLKMRRAEFVLECLSAVANSRRASDNFSALLIDIPSFRPSAASFTKEQNSI